MEFQKISITLPAQTVLEAKALAAERGVSMSRLLAAIIEAELAELREDQAVTPKARNPSLKVAA